MTPADRILPAFARFHGWGYPSDTQQPAVPAPSAPTGDPDRDHLPGVPRAVRLAPPHPKVVDCSTLTAWVLHAAARIAVPLAALGGGLAVGGLVYAGLRLGAGVP